MREATDARQSRRDSADAVISRFNAGSMGEDDNAVAHGACWGQTARTSGRVRTPDIPLGNVSLLNGVYVGVEHLLHFMLAHGADLLLDDTAALEQ